MDITYLNADMSTCFGIKYLFTIIDSFCRKAMIYSTNSKKPDILIKFFKDFCMHNNIPKELASDNGAEFKNKIFNNFCEENNIKFVHGVPYSPHSMGVIERFNYTIKKYLSKEYISNGENNIDFESCRMKILNYYNNKNSSFIGHITKYSSYNNSKR